MPTSALFELSRRKPTAVGTGLIALDAVMNGDDDPPRLWVGGTCGNVLTILSYVGWKSFPLSRLNGDRAAKHVVRDFERWGVRLDFARSNPVVDTPIVVQYIRKTGAGLPYHRFSWSCPNCGRWFPNYKPILLGAAEEIIAGIRDPNVFFFDRASPAALAVARGCAEKGAVVVFEPSGVGNKTFFRQALRVAHILKYSNERLGNLAETVGSARVPLEIETLGGDGLRYRSCMSSCDTRGWRRLEAYGANPFKDAAGAGDWCTAGIIHRLAQRGMSAFRGTVESRLVEALKFGQALAAWSCKFEGARAGMYSVSRAVMRAEVEGIMRGTPRPVALRRKLDVGRAETFKKICEGCDQGDPR